MGSALDCCEEIATSDIVYAAFPEEEWHKGEHGTKVHKVVHKGIKNGTKGIVSHIDGKDIEVEWDTGTTTVVPIDSLKRQDKNAEIATVLRAKVAEAEEAVQEELRKKRDAKE